MAEVIVTMEVGSNGVALITISNSPVNALAVPREICSGYVERRRKSDRFDRQKREIFRWIWHECFSESSQKGDISQLPDVSVALVQHNRRMPRNQ
ncbi:hypothetical protein L1887_06266 [Cichorium endivia]|nr:hypothetical protein L1887_06266 [Cichorium endivia]